MFIDIDKFIRIFTVNKPYSGNMLTMAKKSNWPSSNTRRRSTVSSRRSIPKMITYLINSSLQSSWPADRSPWKHHGWTWSPALTLWLGTCSLCWDLPQTVPVRQPGLPKSVRKIGICSENNVNLYTLSVLPECGKNVGLIHNLLVRCNYQ